MPDAVANLIKLTVSNRSRHLHTGQCPVHRDVPSEHVERRDHEIKRWDILPLL